MKITLPITYDSHNTSQQSSAGIELHSHADQIILVLGSREIRIDRNKLHAALEAFNIVRGGK